MRDPCNCPRKKPTTRSIDLLFSPRVSYRNITSLGGASETSCLGTLPLSRIKRMSLRAKKISPLPPSWLQHMCASLWSLLLLCFMMVEVAGNWTNLPIMCTHAYHFSPSLSFSMIVSRNSLKRKLSSPEIITLRVFSSAGIYLHANSLWHVRRNLSIFSRQSRRFSPLRVNVQLLSKGNEADITIMRGLKG